METNTELFMGRLGVNPELKYTKEQKPVCYLSVAVNKKDQEKAIWKKVVVWGNQAEQCNLYLKKGKFVFVQGRKSLIHYEDKQGNNKSYEEINADLVGFSFTN